MARACSRSPHGEEGARGPGPERQDRRAAARILSPASAPVSAPVSMPVTEDGVTDELVDTADVDSPAELDLDVTARVHSSISALEVEGSPHSPRTTC